MKHILVPLDFSTQAPLVLEEAIRQARVSGARLTVLMVAEDFSDIGDFAHAAQMQHKILEETKAKATHHAETAQAAGVPVETVVIQSPSPADAILQIAEEKNVDFIIMGSRAKTGIDRFLLGSVAGKVVAYAPCSVLVVRKS